MGEVGTPGFIASEMLKLLELMSPMEEAVRGYRATLIENDWPEAESWKVATELLIEFNHKAFS